MCVTALQTLYALVLDGDAKTVSGFLFMNPRANVDEPGPLGNTPLMIAAQMGNVDVAEMLLKRKANPNAVNRDGTTALALAAANRGGVPMCKLLIAYGANPNTGSWSALLATAVTGNATICAFLLKNGANPNAKSLNGHCPLFIAAKNRHDAVCQLLLEHGADAAAENGDDRWTALHIASQSGYTTIARQLLEAKADADKPTPKRETPLFLASSHGHQHVAELLLEHNATMDAAAWAVDELNPMHAAVRNKHRGVIVVLLPHVLKHALVCFRCHFGYHCCLVGNRYCLGAAAILSFRRRRCGSDCQAHCGTQYICFSFS